VNLIATPCDWCRDGSDPGGRSRLAERAGAGQLRVSSQSIVVSGEPVNRTGLSMDPTPATTAWAEGGSLSRDASVPRLSREPRHTRDRVTGHRVTGAPRFCPTESAARFARPWSREDRRT
jgi:hypothetical protein